MLWLITKPLDETDYLGGRGRGLFQRQEMRCPGYIDERRAIAQVLFEFLTIFRRRDLIGRSLQDQLLVFSRRGPQTLERSGFRRFPFDSRRARGKAGLENLPNPGGLGRTGD